MNDMFCYSRSSAFRSRSFEFLAYNRRFKTQSSSFSTRLATLEARAAKRATVWTVLYLLVVFLAFGISLGVHALSPPTHAYSPSGLFSHSLYLSILSCSLPLIILFLQVMCVYV